MSATKIKSRMSKIEAELAAIDARSGEQMTRDDEVRADALTDELRNLESIASEPLPRQVKPDGVGRAFATPRRHSLRCFDNPQKALAFGLWTQALAGNRQAESKLQSIGYGAAMLSGENSKGGYLIPGEFEADLIRLVEERGVFRREARVIPMSQDTLSIPRRTQGLTPYFVGEAQDITASDMTLDLVTLVTKKLATLTTFSSELNHDALIPIADMLATEIAYAFADKEDSCGFNGTGTSEFGGITGIRQSLIDSAFNGDETTPGSAGGVTRYGTGHSYNNISLGLLNTMIGTLPQYAEANAKWYLSKFVWSILLDLCVDAGGNSLEQLQRGPEGRYLLGYPVVISQVMPKESAANQICVLLGDLRLAATMGLHRDYRIETSNSATVGSTSLFATDQLALRGIERFDVVVHDCGNTTTAGPCVGLISHTA